MDVLEVVTQGEKFITAGPESKHGFFRKDKPWLPMAREHPFGLHFLRSLQ